MSYTGKAFLYIEDGEVVANEKLMPKPQDYLSGCFNDIPDDKAYFDALAEWKSQHFKVENGDWVKDQDQFGEPIERPIIVFDWDKQNMATFNNGQPCHIENGKVVKLLI
ncbi:MAG TPA: hypothetical protein VMV77_15170 [Bacteroidales bacterium]|nr:hypothetical protein [Bacteroidales bacterium]